MGFFVGVCVYGRCSNEGEEMADRIWWRRGGRMLMLQKDVSIRSQALVEMEGIQRILLFVVKKKGLWKG